MEERTSAALNRVTNVNVADTNYSTVMARGIVIGAELTPDSSALTSGVIHLTAAENARSGINVGNASGVSARMGKAYFGVGGVAKKIKRMYIGVPSVGHDLPAGYTEYESMTAYGGKYIDTGYNHNARTVYEFRMRPHSTTSYGDVIGARTAYQDADEFTVLQDNDYLSCNINGTGKIYIISDIDTETVYTGTVSVREANVNGVTKSTGKTTVDTCEYTDFIFGCNQKGTYSGDEQGSTIYYLNIIENGTYLHKYVPCKNPSGSFGMYDLVDGEFRAFSGSGGTVTAGAAVGGSRARVFFEAIPEIVPITVTNSDRQTSAQARYINYNGRQYSSAASFNANPNDEIRISVRGYNSQYSGKVTVNGTRVFTQNSNSFGNYTYKVPEGGSVTIDLVQKSTTVSKTTYYYGEISITEDA